MRQAARATVRIDQTEEVQKSLSRVIAKESRECVFVQNGTEFTTAPCRPHDGAALSPLISLNR